MRDALTSFTPVVGSAQAVADAEVARLLHWFFDGDPPADLQPAGLRPCEAGALLRRSRAGNDPVIVTIIGSRASG
ncbi:MAG: hypothetical protein RL654_2793 [Pseudomonadota bacterium]|jgi:hypothetical protein